MVGRDSLKRCRDRVALFVQRAKRAAGSAASPRGGDPDAGRETAAQDM
jgi:hypothetical protein